MYIYLRHGKCVKRVSNITLQRCYRPCVGTFVEDRIEPALWYKVLVLDSIFVDCDNRTVFWNIEKCDSSRHLHHLETYELKVNDVTGFFKGKDQIFRDRQYYDFDPTVDELFETTRHVLTNLNPEVINKVGNEATYEDLLKLIHVFILPEIQFHAKDRDNVESVIAEIEKQHEYIEDQIQKKDNTKRNTENSLWKQRQNILRTENFSSTLYVSGLDERFLKIVLQHIEKDLQKLNEIFVRTDEQIRPLRLSTSERDIKRLDGARGEQVEVFSSIEKFTVAREEIKNVLFRDHIKKSFRKNRSNTTDFHLLYIEVDRRLQTINTELKDLIYSKIKLSSVREAALLTLKELDSDGSSYGYNRKKGTFEVETDLFDPSKKPEEWTTLSEKVTTYLSVKQFGFRGGYEKFCQMIKQKCQQLYDESKLFSAPMDIPVSPTTADLIEKIGSESVRRRTLYGRDTSNTSQSMADSRVVTRKRTFSSRWSMGSISRSACEAICREIIEHISEIAYMLALEITGVSKEKLQQSIVNKVYTCYEQHISEELMPVLCELYEKSYTNQCVGLAQWIAQYSASEVGFGEKTMTGLMRVSTESSFESTESSDSDMDEDETCLKRLPISMAEPTPKSFTLSSRNLKNMPWDELYSRMNRQHESMAQSFVGALDMDIEDFNPTIIEGSPHETFNNKLDDTTEGIDLEDSFVHISLQTDARNESRGEQETSRKELEPQRAAGYTSQLSNGLETQGAPPSYTQVQNEVVPMRRPTSENPPPYSTLPPLKQQFYQAFNKFFEIIEEEDSACTLFSKLRTLTRAVKFVENQISKQRAENNKDSMTCTDDLLDVVILLLCMLDETRLLKLYAHMNLLIQLSPQFMQGNAHDYSLVTISVAYQHLFEQQVLHRNSRPKNM